MLYGEEKVNPRRSSRSRDFFYVENNEEEFRANQFAKRLIQKKEKLETPTFRRKIKNPVYRKLRVSREKRQPRQDSQNLEKITQSFFSFLTFKFLKIWIKNPK